MHKEVRCFVPAAGLGERMRPISDYLPKPLLPVLGKPVLGHVLEKLSRLGGLAVHHIGINLHHKKEPIREWVENSPYKGSVFFFPEDHILDTGGALKNAESFLSEGGVFLVHNADILSDFDLAKLLEHHHASGNMLTLAVHDCLRFNTVAVDSSGNLIGVAGKSYLSDPAKGHMMAYTGIAVYDRAFLKFLPDGKSSVVDAWINAAAAGCRACTMDVTGSYWADLGTPAAYASAVFDSLRAEGETVYFHPESRGCAGTGIDGYIVAEKGCSIEQGVSLRNCIVLPGGIAVRGAYENCIIGPGFALSFVESAAMAASADNGTLIGVGGSDRKYFRVQRNGRTAVMMKCEAGDPDFTRHMEYTLFFRKFAVPVPELINVDTEKMVALFEDLGDVSLYSWLKCPRPGLQVERLYRKALDVLVLLHGAVTDNVAVCPLLANRLFDYEHLRWETAYFIERFVVGLRRMVIPDAAMLDDEFNRLALKVDAFPKAAVHRDFQSQNIMVALHETTRLIDYQGARMAPPAYDVVSLLWDPYCRLDDAARTRLLDYYLDAMSALRGAHFDTEQFSETLLPCRLQRHMQALGAYGFLSSVKGKKYFLKFVPEALRMLRDEAALAKNDYPVLYALITKLCDN